MEQPENTVFKCVAGSRLYGLDTPASDLDVRGVYVERLEDLLNVEGRQNLELSDERQDEKYYSLGKFLKLAAECNPSVVELLFVPADAVLKSSASYEHLVRHREWFVSKRARHTFGGYAFAQLKRAKGINKKGNLVGRYLDEDGLRFAWSVATSSDEIRRRAFSQLRGKIPAGFSAADVERLTCGDFMKYLGKLRYDERDLSVDGYRAFLKMVHPVQRSFMYRYDVFGGRVGRRSPLFWDDAAGCGLFTDLGYVAFELPGTGLYGASASPGARLLSDDGQSVRLGSPDGAMAFMFKYDEEGYRRSLSEYRSFWEWMANRNEARYSYDWDGENQVDWKSMVHLMRLLISARNVATEGAPKVRLEGDERSYLMDVRSGALPYDRVVADAEEMMASLDELFECSGLPDSPNLKEINAWYVSTVMHFRD